MADEPSAEALESKEAIHRRFYEAFHEWFMKSGCDFWLECNAPEELAIIAVELADAACRRGILDAPQWRPISEVSADQRHGAWVRQSVEVGVLHCPLNGEATHFLMLSAPAVGES